MSCMCVIELLVCAMLMAFVGTVEVDELTLLSVMLVSGSVSYMLPLHMLLDEECLEQGSSLLRLVVPSVLMNGMAALRSVRIRMRRLCMVVMTLLVSVVFPHMP